MVDIHKIMKWYEAIVSKKEQFVDIETLMKARAKLAIGGYDLSVEFAKEKQELRLLECDYDISKDKRVIKLMADTDPDTSKTYSSAKANQLADSELENIRIRIATLEGMTDGKSKVLAQTNKVLDAMQQDIAELRELRKGKNE